MKNHQFLAASMVLGLGLSAAGVSFGATNGIILISTRAAQDSQGGSEYVSAEWGPGMVTPGDVEMGSLLANQGYSFRLVLDKLLGEGASVWGQDPAIFVTPVDPAFSPALIILSGSSGSSDVPPPNKLGIPVMMGEHVTLGDRSDRVGSIFMYSRGSESSDPNQGNGASRYMKVINAAHPIMQGIPLDSQGRVKIFRETYAEESAHIPEPLNAGNKRPNYEFRWCTQAVSNAAPGTTVLGVLDGNESRSCFAVADAGGQLSNGESARARLVHMFTNEQGSGGPRRVFLALTEWGRILFVRAAKWAMGETLSPYEGFRILEATPAGPASVRVSWQGSAAKNYQLYAAADPSKNIWSPVANDIGGAAGLMTRTFDVSQAPGTLFLRLRAMP